MRRMGMQWDGIEGLKCPHKLLRLYHIHRVASLLILHRDIKAANILLDDNWDAKVADFGVSRLIPNGDEDISIAVQGTLGYLDSEYFQTLQLTNKSDVYSMAVMLVKLMTRLKPSGYSPS